MKTFRNFLIWIKRQYNTKPLRLFVAGLVLIAVFTTVAFLVDIYVPFGGWWTLIRTGVMVLQAPAIFVVSYAFSIFMHMLLTSQGKGWKPLRSRWSPTWRKRIAIIVAAAGFLLVYATTNQIGTTTTSAIYAALAIGLVAFIRTTSEEQQLADMGIPDYRDIEQGKRIEQIREVRKHKIKDKKKAKKKTKTLSKILEEDDSLGTKED